jgi:hypothetical protein
MSIEGLSVIVPRIEIDGCSLGRHGASLLANLEFPDKQYQVVAITVRYQPCQMGTAGGYLVGLRIRSVMGGKVLRLFKSFTQYAQRMEQRNEARGSEQLSSAQSKSGEALKNAPPLLP